MVWEQARGWGRCDPWGAYRDATQRARQKGAAMLCHDDLLVDGDRCSVLLRMPGATNLLMP